MHLPLDPYISCEIFVQYLLQFIINNYNFYRRSSLVKSEDTNNGKQLRYVHSQHPSLPVRVKGKSLLNTSSNRSSTSQTVENTQADKQPWQQCLKCSSLLFDMETRNFGGGPEGCLNVTAQG